MRCSSVRVRRARPARLSRRASAFTARFNNCSRVHTRAGIQASPGRRRPRSTARSSATHAAYIEGNCNAGWNKAREEKCCSTQERRAVGVATERPTRRSLARPQDLWCDHHSAGTIVREKRPGRSAAEDVLAEPSQLADQLGTDPDQAPVMRTSGLLELRRRDSVLLHLDVQRLVVGSEQPRRLALVPSRALEDPADRVLFGIRRGRLGDLLEGGPVGRRFGRDGRVTERRRRA